MSNEIVSGLDWFPTLLAAGGDTGVKERLLKRWQTGGRTYKVHLDGYNLLPYLEGKEEKSPRKEFFHFSDDAELVAFRYGNWKFVFCEQRAPGTLQVWGEPFTCMRIFKIFNLRMDPYERADITSNTYWDWVIRHAFTGVPAQHFVGQFLATFKEFPPRQRAASFTIDQLTEKLLEGLGPASR